MQLPLMPDTVKNNSAKTVQFLENVGERDMGKGNEPVRADPLRHGRWRVATYHQAHKNYN